MYSKNIIKSLLASSSILFLGRIDSYLMNLSFTLIIYFLLGRSLKNSSIKQYNILIIFLLPHLLISLIIGYFRLWEIHIFFPESSIAVLLSLIWANISNSSKSRVEIGLISSVKLDEIDRIKQFIAKNSYSFIQYYDSTGVWADQLKIKKVPVGVLLNGKGEIVYRHSGFGGELETQTFKKELINRIESLLISNSSSF